ncbi:Septin-domain-containing protein [Umbelopsis sp. PMI_123]|nr:Septin-domain-containing protein [Umbelopsis sp. PMI_123]
MPLEYALQRRGAYPDLGAWRTAPPQQATKNTLIGMDALPYQTVQKVNRQPFRLNVMVVGESGLGKTTFMNTLFNTDLVSDTDLEEPAKTVKIHPVTYEMTEKNTTLQLTVIDTPGFGDRLDRSEDIKPLVQYIESQYQAYWDAEKVRNVRLPPIDTRVHVCLYFISPSGHSLKAHDVIALQELSSRVNVIPIIAKADTLTKRERKLFKEKILNDLDLNAVPIYPTAYTEHHDTLDHVEQHIPFAVIGSEIGLQSDDDTPIRGRQYDWGIAEVENEKHCDFIHLRELLFIQCLAELVDITHIKHYHDYRAAILRKDGRPPSILECDEEYDLRIEDARKSISERLQRKDEEIRQNFVQLARQQELALKKQEEKLQKTYKELMEDIEREKAKLASEEQAYLQTLESRQSVKAGKRS